MTEQNTQLDQMDAKVDAVIQSQPVEQNTPSQGGMGGTGEGEAVVVFSGNAAQYDRILEKLKLAFMGLGHIDPLLPQVFTLDKLEAIVKNIIKAADAYELDLSKYIGDGGSKLEALIDLAYSIGVPVFIYMAAKKELSKSKLAIQPNTDNKYAAQVETDHGAFTSQ